MRICMLSAVFCCLFQAQMLVGQGQDVKVMGDFNDLPFPEFVQEIESQTGVNFYYIDKWVSGIKITASGEGLSLKKILQFL